MAAAIALQSALFIKSQRNHAQVFSRSSFIQSQGESFPRRISDCTLTSNYLYFRRSYRITRAPRLKISCTSQQDDDSNILKNISNELNVSEPATPLCTSKKDDDSNILKNVSNELNVSKPATPTSTTKEVTSTNFTDIFSFSGPAPETINGRLAMLGFVSALGVEIATGRDLMGQLQNGGLGWFLAAAVLFTMASLFPLFQGVSPESKSKDFFSTKAETWNGRAAMVGLVALALTEYVKGGALF